MAGLLRDAADKPSLQQVRAESAPQRIAPPADRPPPQSAPARRRIPRLALGLAIAAAIGGWFWLRPAPVAEPPKTAPVTLGAIEDAVLATGLVKPTDLVAVGAQVSGRVTNLAVTLGQEVAAGDLIAEIDPIPRRNALLIAESGLAQVRAELTEQEATLAEQQRVLARREALAARSAISESEVETAASEVAVTRARMEALEARIRSAEVTVENARVDLDYARITAPTDGTVLAVVTQQGQTLNAMQTTPTIVVLGRLDVMSIEAEISEADVVRVMPGQDVWFTIVGDPGARYTAQLASVAPAPTSITRDTLLTGETSTTTSATSGEAIYYNGHFTVPNPEGRLRTYMTAEVHVVLGRAEDVPTIPAAALGSRNPDGSRQVTVLLSDGALEARNVEVGLGDQARVEVRSGLAVGEAVVIDRAVAAGADDDAPPPADF